MVRSLDQQVTRLQRETSDLHARIDQAGGAAASGQLVRRREALEQRMSQLESERASVQTPRALWPKADVLDAASSPAQQLPGRRLPDLVLGGLLGLLVGVGAAAMVESLRPTLVGRTAIARGTEAPVLAELVGPPQRRGHRPAGGHADGRRRPGARAELQPEALQTEGEGGRIGLVVVASTLLKLADLDPVKDFLTISGWPLLGVAVHRSPRRKALVPGGQRSTRSQDTSTEVDA